MIFCGKLPQYCELKVVPENELQEFNVNDFPDSEQICDRPEMPDEAPPQDVRELQEEAKLPKAAVVESAEHLGKAPLQTISFNALAQVEPRVVCNSGKVCCSVTNALLIWLTKYEGVL